MVLKINLISFAIVALPQKQYYTKYSRILLSLKDYRLGSKLENTVSLKSEKINVKILQRT